MTDTALTVAVPQRCDSLVASCPPNCPFEVCHGFHHVSSLRKICFGGSMLFYHRSIDVAGNELPPQSMGPVRRLNGFQRRGEKEARARVRKYFHFWMIEGVQFGEEIVNTIARLKLFEHRQLRVGSRARVIKQSRLIRVSAKPASVRPSIGRDMSFFFSVRQDVSEMTIACSSRCSRYTCVSSLGRADVI